MTCPTLIHHFLEQSAQRFADKVALVHEGTRATYAEIDAKANRLGNWFLDQGVARGDRVAILLENSLEYVVAYYGALKAGAIAVPLSTGLSSNELQSLLEELEPAAIVSARKFERLFKNVDISYLKKLKVVIRNCSSLSTGLGLRVTEFREIMRTGKETAPKLEIDESSVANIIYTSGSMGKPKGVMLTHHNILSNTLAICQYLELTEKDVQMVVLPFFYVMGKSLLNTHFAVGARVVINNRFAYPAGVLKQMVEEEVTGFSGVPSTYAYLLYRSPMEKYRNKFQSLRYCSQAGGHMARATKAELRHILPEHTKIYVMYGATEASARLTYLDPNRFNDKMDSIGKPISGVTLKVLNTIGNELPPGQHGEIVASGNNIMKGYWRDPDATSRVLDKNGYHTGDLGYMDEEGFFYVIGRKDNILKVRGHRINPMEVEEAIVSSGLVTEAVVLGLDDDLLGNKLVALAVPKDKECRVQDILYHCSQLLARYKLPSEMRLLRAIPKSPSGKIDDEACRALARGPHWVLKGDSSSGIMH